MDDSGGLWRFFGVGKIVIPVICFNLSQTISMVSEDLKLQPSRLFPVASSLRFSKEPRRRLVQRRVFAAPPSSDSSHSMDATRVDLWVGHIRRREGRATVVELTTW